MPYTPPYPKPLDASSKRSLWNLFRRGRKSWLATLYEGSYSGKISRVRLPGVQLFIVKLPHLIKEVLVDQFEHYPKHEISDMAFKPLLGRSMLTTTGPEWERQRRMLDPAFGQAKLKEVFTLMSGGADEMLGRFDNAGDGAVMNIELEMTHVTADIILRTILSESLESEGARKIYEGFKVFQENAVMMIQLGFFRLPLWLAPRPYLAWKRSGKEIRGLLAASIRGRYEDHQRGITSVKKDILQALLETRDPLDGSAFNLDELIDMVAVLFFAGHETSATALSWSFFLISKSPEIQERLHAEACQVLGERSPEFADIPKLKQIRNVFREALRLYPPIGFLNYRKPVGERKIDKYDLPDGSPIIISPWLVHRHREVWERPDEFDPDRFAGGLDKPPCAYIPFGQGPRICIGAAFAMQEAMLILATLVRRYRIEPGPGPDPEPASRLTIRSLNGISLRVWKRPETTHSQAVPDDIQVEEAKEQKCPFH